MPVRAVLPTFVRRLLASRSLEERCVPVAMDAQKPYIKEGVADLVFGAAILHHLLDPMTFVQHAMKVLKPGGVAFFFEPLEGGYATLVAICDEVSAEANFVSTRPGAMALTRMPRPPTSTARVWVMEITAALLMP